MPHVKLFDLIFILTSPIVLHTLTLQVVAIVRIIRDDILRESGVWRSLLYGIWGLEVASASRVSPCNTLMYSGYSRGEKKERE